MVQINLADLNIQRKISSVRKSCLNVLMKVYYPFKITFPVFVLLSEALVVKEQQE